MRVYHSLDGVTHSGKKPTPLFTFAAAFLQHCQHLTVKCAALWGYPYGWFFSTQHNGIQLDNTQNNETQHNGTQHYDIQLNDPLHNDTWYYDILHNDTQQNDTKHNDAQDNDTKQDDIMYNDEKVLHS